MFTPAAGDRPGARLDLTRFEDMRFNSILQPVLPYVNFAQFRNVLGGTLKYV